MCLFISISFDLIFEYDFVCHLQAPSSHRAQQLRPQPTRSIQVHRVQGSRALLREMQSPPFHRSSSALPPAHALPNRETCSSCCRWARRASHCAAAAGGERHHFRFRPLLLIQNGADGVVKHLREIVLAEGGALHVAERCTHASKVRMHYIHIITAARMAPGYRISRARKRG